MLSEVRILNKVIWPINFAFFSLFILNNNDIFLPKIPPLFSCRNGQGTLEILQFIKRAMCKGKEDSVKPGERTDGKPL